MSDWHHYLARFHEDRPGITETVLSRTQCDGRTPYDWLIEPLRESSGPVIDVACGSAPLWNTLAARGWIGVDVSSAELRAAAVRGARPVLRGDANAIPVATRSAGAVVCSMALMIVQPFDDVLAEVARMLPAGGMFSAIVPTAHPLSLLDRVRYGRLLVALRRRRLGYPNDAHLTNVRSALERRDLRLVSDDRRRFVWTITDRSQAAEFVRSLYLPGEAPERVEAAEGVACGWVGKEVGLPLRRLVAVRVGS